MQALVIAAIASRSVAAGSLGKFFCSDCALGARISSFVINALNRNASGKRYVNAATALRVVGTAALGAV
jgi:hypothetical protein